nr:helix-turn-helix domain-containing protein [Paracoccus mutanolyticus]
MIQRRDAAFARYLGRSPKRYYMELRLERARNLLMQTEMAVMEIALACGFTSARISRNASARLWQHALSPARRRGGGRLIAGPCGKLRPKRRTAPAFCPFCALSISIGGL